MKRLELLDRMLLDARKTKNVLVKNLLLTMKGEFQNKSNTSKDSEDVLIEKIAKSMIKSANEVGTSDSELEIEILTNFVPKQLSNDEIRVKALTLVKDNPGKPMGFYMGNLLKDGDVDGKAANKILGEVLNS